MRPHVFFSFLFFLFSFITINMGYAQSLNSGDNEIYISQGIVSTNELAGFGEGAISTYMSFPNSITGAVFLTYRKHLTKTFSLGVTAGLDNQQGDLSYGDEHHGSFGGYSGTSGSYNRRDYTFAAEVQCAYMKMKGFAMYGCLGAGYTISRTKYTFFNGIYDPQYFYGDKNSLVPSNPYTADFSHFNADIMPLGLRFGNDLAFFLEFGFGYKGLIRGGLSLRF